MAKHHALFEHTADVGLWAKADTLPELFEALAEGLAALVCDPATVQPASSRQLSVREEEDDLEGLAVDFLWEVLGLLEQEHFMVRTARVTRIDPRLVDAELDGESYDPRRHELIREVKAVTWHQLVVARREGLWQGRVILDL